MARYIDADALIKKIFPYDVVDKRCYTINAKMIYEEIQKAPTADVAPKSEVEDIEADRNKYQNWWCQTNSELEKAKSEVAREIVEFLFRRSKSLQHLFKDNPDSAQCFRGRFELENAAVIIANEYGVELKKEYGVTDINVGNKYFTAEQVRAMSREEVRINYWAIMESMKKWGEQK